ncbi:MAG: toll/interleukin-1 receptor domain-containing protein [Pseudomonadota bacterium]
MIDELAEELKIVPLVLNRAGARMVREEIQIDVRGDPRRDIFDEGRPILIPGIKVVVSVPFTGDKELWHLQPSSFQYSDPRGTIHLNPGGDGGYLDLAFKQPSDEPLDQIKAALDRQLNNIEFFLNSQARDLEGYGSQLRSQIAAPIADRRSRLTKHDSLSALLGIPEVQRLGSPTQNVGPPTSKAVTGTTPPAYSNETQTWDVFVSHASEDKESFVRPLVDALRQSGLTVWYDEATLRVGDGLRRSIEKGLAKSQYGIVVISRAFLAKEWPQRELDGLVAKEEDGTKVVLPVWHDITAQEVRSRSPMLADRLAVPSSRGVKAVVQELLQVIRPA